MKALKHTYFIIYFIYVVSEYPTIDTTKILFLIFISFSYGGIVTLDIINAFTKKEKKYERMDY